jgi:hypothetical protein
MSKKKTSRAKRARSRESAAAKKHAVCVGINDYPGQYNDLSGCVNDAEDWSQLLRSQFGFGSSVTLLLNGKATRNNMLSALEDLISTTQAGDLAVFTYSGHGTWQYDRGQRDESDNRDEALCAHDGIILDDEIRVRIRRLKPGARLTVVADSCHSGTVTKQMLMREYARDESAVKHSPKPRYMPPSDEIDALRTLELPVRRRMMYPESDMAEMLLTGCNATEYSYDAYIGGRYNGAMSYYAINLIKSKPRQTYREMHRRLRRLLPSSRYPQSPQLEGSDENKDRPLFS